MISHPRHLTGFLLISMTVHAAVLLLGAPPAYHMGNTGKVVHLTMVDSSGAAEAPAVDKPADAIQSVPEASSQHPVSRPAREAIGKHSIPRPQRSSTTAPQQHPPQPVPGPRRTTGQAAGSPAPTPEESDRHLRQSLLELIAQRLTYPLIARRKGWQGIVKLELHIESSGLITSTRIHSTSGYPVLDRAAVNSLQLVNVPHASRWLNGHAVDIVIPVEYRLVDS